MSHLFPAVFPGASNPDYLSAPKTHTHTRFTNYQIGCGGQYQKTRHLYHSGESAQVDGTNSVEILANQLGRQPFKHLKGTSRFTNQPALMKHSQLYVHVLN